MRSTYLGLIPKLYERAGTSDATVGSALEKEINDANRYYLATEQAVIYKKPTPIQLVKVDYPKRSAAVVKEAYFKRSMELLDPALQEQLFTNDLPVMTKAHDTTPAKYEPGAHVANSLVSSGTNPVVRSLVIDGIFGGVGSVLSFMPIIGPSLKRYFAQFFSSSMMEMRASRASCRISAATSRNRGSTFTS